MAMSKAWAALSGREYVIPDDVQTLFPYVCTHRMMFRGGMKHRTEEVLAEIVAGIAPPVEKWTIDN